LFAYKRRIGKQARFGSAKTVQNFVLHSLYLCYQPIISVGRGFPRRPRTGDGGSGLRGEQREAGAHLGAARRFGSAPGSNLRRLHQCCQAQEGCSGTQVIIFLAILFYILDYRVMT